MYELRYRFKFCSAHFLRDYEGICKNTHGHNWEGFVTIVGSELAPNGTLIDFYDVDRAVQPVVKDLDHGMINDIPPFDKISPTSENLAKWIYDRLAPTFATERTRLDSVSIREYEDSLVTYRPD
jgi:6-pyruvoyltetrahydropterin/6-carboxytetrahydropterin synthase